MSSLVHHPLFDVPCPAESAGNVRAALSRSGLDCEISCSHSIVLVGGHSGIRFLDDLLPIEADISVVVCVEPLNAFFRHSVVVVADTQL